MKTIAPKFHTKTYSYLALRKAVGWIGILLPFVLALGVIIDSGKSDLIPSISHYYYSVMGDVFVGAICAVALFMFFYCGYDKRDDRAGNIAGFFAIGLALFPTTQFHPTELIGYIHFACAAIFFLTLSYYSLFLFTLTVEGEKPKGRKLARNRIYITCGVIMIACLIAIAIYSFVTDDTTKTRFIFWAESIALVAFGISWLTKGETIFQDTELNSAP